MNYLKDYLPFIIVTRRIQRPITLNEIEDTFGCRRHAREYAEKRVGAVKGAAKFEVFVTASVTNDAQQLTAPLRLG
jgi:hypothetical protein